LSASRIIKEDSLEFDGKTLRVHPIPDNLATSALLENIDLVIFATPPEVSRQLAPVVAETGIATIEIGGALMDRAPMLVPSISTQTLDRFVETRMVSSPAGPAVALAMLLDPLIRMGASSCKGTIMLSAGHAGRDGVKELSQQVISLFNGGEPPRQVFPSGLAFDIISEVGDVREGWSIVERRIALEVSQLVSMHPNAIAMTAVTLPLFVGIGLSLFVEMDPLPPLEDIRHFLSESESIRLGDPVPGPRRLAGRSHLYVGRLRVDPMGNGIHVWAALDNLRVGATTNALAIATHLYRDGHL